MTPSAAPRTAATSTQVMPMIVSRLLTCTTAAMPGTVSGTPCQ
jgi:hypothetical protein